MYKYKIIKTKDGSNTLFSTEYNEHYHNVNDGAMFEALSKHVIPALKFHQDKDRLKILDICFGLGYNTLGTIFYLKKHNIKTKVSIYSPELDLTLIQSLKDFKYPKEFENIKYIIDTLIEKHYFEDEQIKITLYIKDARKYLAMTSLTFDIIYQDPFSSNVNTKLWTKEYFDLLYKHSNSDTIITTYSISTPVRLSMYEAGYFIYDYTFFKKKQTLAFTKKQYTMGDFIDMSRKKRRSPFNKPLYDNLINLTS